MNKVVARFLDGRVLKGMTADFFPAKDLFHVSLTDASGAAETLPVLMPQLKALFFVKDLDGNPQYDELRDFDPAQPLVGRRIRVVFKDGEVLVGTTMGYRADRPGFFIEPADGQSNNERCYVNAAATQEVTLL